MKKVASLLLIFVLTILTSIGVFANEELKLKSFTAEQNAKLLEALNENEVPIEKQIILINKLNNGEKWDCFSNDKKPVSTKAWRDDKSTYNKAVYEDGSFVLSEIGDPNININPDLPLKNESGISLNAISGGTIESKSFYHYYIKGVKVSKKTGLINAQFFVDYTINRGNFDKIHRAYNEKVIVVLGYASGVNLSVVTPRETYYKPAEAKLSFDAVGPQGLIGGNCWLKFTIKNDNVYDKHSF